MSSVQAELFDVLPEPALRAVPDLPPAPLAPPVPASEPTGPDAGPQATEPAPELEVRVVRSAKRRKTIQARMAGEVLEVLVPAWMSKAEEAEAVAAMVERFARKRKAKVIDLERRARELAERHGLRTPKSIRWVENQQWRWGSCTPEDGTIRISSRLAEFPLWVLDAVIVHELAHLHVFGHGPDFYELADRYPLAERAKGFLIAKGLDL